MQIYTINTNVNNIIVQENTCFYDYCNQLGADDAFVIKTITWVSTFDKKDRETTIVATTGCDYDIKKAFKNPLVDAVQQHTVSYKCT